MEFSSFSDVVTHCAGFMWSGCGSIDVCFTLGPSGGSPKGGKPPVTVLCQEEGDAWDFFCLQLLVYLLSYLNFCTLSTPGSVHWKSTIKWPQNVQFQGLLKLFHPISKCTCYIGLIICKFIRIFLSAFIKKIKTCLKMC